MHYIGMDCHITTLDFAVVNDAGRLVKSSSVATSVKNFMEFVKTVPPPRTIYMEESALAAWALETCVRFGEKLVITDPKQNHWIGSSVQKDDPLDALKLAQLGRGGYIKEIHHPVGERRRFRELMDTYHDTVKSTTRIKNKIKSKFRQNGIQCTGVTVYSETYREEWKRKLPQDATSASYSGGSLASTETIRANRKGSPGSCQSPGQTLSRNQAFSKIFPGLALLVRRRSLLFWKLRIVLPIKGKSGCMPDWV